MQLHTVRSTALVFLFTGVGTKRQGFTSNGISTGDRSRPAAGGR